MSGKALSPIAAWFRSSRRMLAAELSQGGWLNFGAFRWSDTDVPRGLRAGVGMITPLALGLATGHLEYGVYASLGALPAGFVSFQGASRTRVSAVVLAAFGMAVATFTGGVAAYAGGWLLLVAVLIFSYLSGLLATLGQRFQVVGLQWAIQLVIASAVPLPPGDAAVRAGLVLAGGLWQGALVVASWAVTRGNQERTSLAGVYRALARYAEQNCRRTADGPVPPPAGFGSDAVHDPNPLLREQERYRFLLLLEQAGRIRMSLAALASYGASCSVLEPVATILGGFAGALEARRGHREQADALLESLAAIEVPPDAPWRWAAASLLGEMRGAVRILRRLDLRDTEPAADPVPRPGHRRGTRRAGLRASLAALRASAGTATETGRHALRLAVVAGIGEIVAVASGLPHGYWIVLTILIVLRPDYASTIYRGVQRAAGTVIGAGLGVATALLLHVGTAALVAAVGVTMTVGYAIFAVNYLLFAVFLTDFVVLLMALLGETAEQTAAARLIGTGIGAALALIGYLAWPSWEGESAQQKLARLFETQAHYAAMVLRACARPGGMDAHARRLSAGPAGRTARQARSDAEASADRLADEPSRPPMTARLAYDLTGIGRRIAHASLTLQAAVEAAHAGQKAPGGKTGDGAEKAGSRETPGGDAKAGGERIEGLAGAVDQFADGVETAGQVIAGSLRSLRPPGDMPPLRELQTAIYDQLSQPRTTAGPASRNGDGRDLADRNEPADRLAPSGSQDPHTARSPPTARTAAPPGRPEWSAAAGRPGARRAQNPPPAGSPAQTPVTARRRARVTARRRTPVTARGRAWVTRRAPAWHLTTRTRCSSVPLTSSPTRWTPLPTCSAAA